MSIPAIVAQAKVNLPRTYEAARVALSECQAMDECKDWADKAAALASYAAQAKDDELERMAQRIRARAIRRAGELLTQIEPATGTTKKDGSGPLSRKEAAHDAGLSERQQKQAVRVAAVPESEFERQVEQPKPVTITALAQQGKKARNVVDLKGRDPREFNRALHFLGSFEFYARELEKENVDGTLTILTDAERQKLRGYINRIDAIHDRIMTRI